MTSFLDRQLTSQPLHLPGGPWGFGLGDVALDARVFRALTWQVPGSMGFVGSERETKHHPLKAAFWLTAAPITQSGF